jgi:Predicted ATPase (AAA+ superfamily)
MIKRQKYLDTLILSKNTKFVKVITGVRRCGKSTLLKLYNQYLLETGVPETNIIFLNFEDYNLQELLEPKKLHDYLQQHIVNTEMHYIILDEVQLVADFPKVVDSMYIRDNIDIYITGSNADLFSSDIATMLSGRYVEIEMLPLSFREYVDENGQNNTLEQNYNNYISQSSFPHVLELQNNPQMIEMSLQGIYDSIIVKDVVTRYQIRDMLIFDNVTKFIFDNISNIVSTKKISDTLTSFGRKVSITAVEQYLNALTSSFVVYNCKRYDIKGQQHLKSLSKYYVVDIGLRQIILQKRGGDEGRILENVVYLELIRRGYNVYIGIFDQLEVDFVAIKPNEVIYFQVAATVRDENTLARELKPLQKIKDSYPKYILTLDEDLTAVYAGIIKTNALTWLYDE